MNKRSPGEGSCRPISYEVEVWGESRKQELPLVICVFGDFSGKAAEQRGVVDERSLVAFDAADAGAIFTAFEPRVEIPLQSGSAEAGPSDTLTLRFRDKADLAHSNIEQTLRAALIERTGRPPGDDAVAAMLQYGALQRLRSSLLGLCHLLESCDDGRGAKLRVMDISRAEFASVFRQSVDLDQSILFRRIYEQEYGQLGGEPYGLVVADFSFGRDAPDVFLLERLAELGSDAMCLVIASAAPRMFGVDDWADFAAAGSIEPIFSSAAYLEWRALRERQETRNLVLTVPAPAAIRDDGRIGDGYRLAAALARTYCATGSWHSSRSGEAVESTRSAADDDRVAELARCGFVAGQDGDILTECSPLELRAVLRANLYPDSERTASAQYQALLSVILPTLEFGRAIKCIVRDRIGAFVDESDTEAWLNRWIQGYVDDGTAPPGEDEPGTGPLLAARIEVRNSAGLSRGSGTYTVDLFLRPNVRGLAFTDFIRYRMEIPAGMPFDDDLDAEIG